MRSFYKVFEDRHRGARSLIRSRLKVYLPIVEPLKMVYEHPDILDLGCGRGEWLELMKNNGFDTKGIDLDEGMLEDCIDLSLDVYQVDVLEYLRGLDADSVCLVSALHLVEHINFDKVLNLVSEALRVLKPGGLLILETPNSENLVVGTSNFYLDPTHQKPLPAELLSFVAEYAGFCRVKTLYLQESPDLTISHRTTLINVLQGVSPDYAIIAQKTASSDVLNLFDASINHVYGIRLNDLAERYDQQNELKIQSLVNSYLSFTNKSFQEREVIYERRFEELFQEREVIYERRFEELFQEREVIYERRFEELFQEREAIYASRSWRITKPLRLLSLEFGKTMNAVFKLCRLLRGLFKLPFKWILTRSLRFINKYPVLKDKVRLRLGKYPTLKAHLSQYARLREPTYFDGKNSHVADTVLDDDLTYLSPRARRIYCELKVSKDLYGKEIRRCA